MTNNILIILQIVIQYSYSWRYDSGGLVLYNELIYNKN